MDQGQCNTVVIGKNRFTGELVAIKSINTIKYKKLANDNDIAEADAMNACKDSQNVVRLLDSFELDNMTYLVTKFAEGKDLLEYCISQPNENQWLSEKRARHIFK